MSRDYYRNLTPQQAEVLAMLYYDLPLSRRFARVKTIMDSLKRKGCVRTGFVLTEHGLKELQRYCKVKPS